MLATIDAVKQLLIDTSDKDDVRITACLTRASAIIERYCNRTFAQTAFVEFYDGTGTDSLQLRNYPIIGTPTVLENGGALTVGTDPSLGPEVLIYAREGRLVRNFSIWWEYHNYYKISYSAGYATVPPEIADAAIEMTLIMLKEKDRVGLAQHTTGTVTSTYIRSLPQAAQWALDLHRDPTLGRAA